MWNQERIGARFNHPSSPVLYSRKGAIIWAILHTTLELPTGHSQTLLKDQNVINKTCVSFFSWGYVGSEV